MLRSPLEQFTTLVVINSKRQGCRVRINFNVLTVYDIEIVFFITKPMNMILLTFCRIQTALSFTYLAPWKTDKRNLYVPFPQRNVSSGSPACV